MIASAESKSIPYLLASCNGITAKALLCIAVVGCASWARRRNTLATLAHSFVVSDVASTGSMGSSYRSVQILLHWTVSCHESVTPSPYASAQDSYLYSPKTLSTWVPAVFRSLLLVTVSQSFF